MKSSDDSGFLSLEYDSTQQSISNLQSRVEVGSSEERYRRFVADHGLANEFENSFASSSSSSSEESDEDMEDFTAWIAFSKQNTIDNSSYRRNAEVKAEVKAEFKLTPSQMFIMANQPIVKLTRLVINADQIVAAQKPIRGKIVCELCLDGFKTPKSLKDHTSKLHDMNRPFACSICSTRHKAQQDLKRHITIKHKNKTEILTQT